ncbi:hypothetical protein AAFP32_11945 [Brevibacterium sp. CBA3109]|uniref:Uncharacterized protein n=1 Tax=Brevibacterium koreense TaxID=3140787 RepID=A0AAU7UI55_9MICO
MKTLLNALKMIPRALNIMLTGPGWKTLWQPLVIAAIGAIAGLALRGVSTLPGITLDMESLGKACLAIAFLGACAGAFGASSTFPTPAKEKALKMQTGEVATSKQALEELQLREQIRDLWTALGWGLVIIGAAGSFISQIPLAGS